jgi:hypothetical protein
MSDLLNSLKVSVLGTKSTNIDKEIDSSFQSIEKYSISADRNKYIETIKQIVSKVGVEAPDQILKNLQGNPQVQNYDQSGRVARYAEYDAIVKKISYCQRALETLTDNILSPDDITKRSVQYVTLSQQTEDTGNTDTAIARCKKIEQKIKLDEKIKKIVKSTLKKGDFFTEILVSPKGENALTIIQEGQKYEVTDEVINMGPVLTQNIRYESTEQNQDGSTNQTTNEITAKVQLEYSSMGGPFAGLSVSVLGQNAKGGKYITGKNWDAGKSSIRSKDSNPANDDLPPGEEDDKFKAKFTGDEDEKEERTTLKLKDIFLTTHDPKYIIRLETERFRTCLGYLVFPKVDPNIAQNAALMTAGNSSVDGLCQDIINQLHEKLKTSNDKIKMSDDLRSTVLAYLSKIKTNEDLKVRYVPPELMVHWRINVDMFDPYGESIFECVNFDARLLMALKTATAIKNLTHATDKRIIAVETGLPRDAKNIVEALKEGIMKKKVSIDSMGSIDSIPSQIPTFETIYIPMRDGKRFVEIDQQEWGSNPQNDVDNQKFIRDNIVANLGVPAPYLGLEENMSNRSLLTVENINFCRTIISYQKELSVPLKDLFEKIIKIIYPESFDHLELISITFPEPKISPYEHQMEYVEQMQRLIEALKTLGIPMSWLKKKYLPNIDWDEVQRHSAEETIQQETGEEKSDQDQMGGMGGMY